MRERHLSRREFAGLGAAALGIVGLGDRDAAAQQPQGAPTANAPAPMPRPDSLKSQLLMDLILETAPAVQLGSRTVVSVTAGTFEGPKLKGKVLQPGADWPMSVNPTMRVLDVRTLLETDDAQRIYVTYRGVIYTPPAGQGERYWRTTPIFETNSEKYAWLNHVVAIGVSYTVPQRVAYRIFEIL
jgi:hypothetical protein